eukprot:Sspe_Gene.28862::Locus_13301_Transcript_1_1_Confidence_1.000_Length_2373::g.28862::m.28862
MSSKAAELKAMEHRELEEAHLAQEWLLGGKLSEMEKAGMRLIPPVDWADLHSPLDFEPTEQDIEGYLEWFFVGCRELGIETKEVSEHDRAFARDALQHTLPPRWYCLRIIHDGPNTPLRPPSHQPLFYYNFHTGESTWEPPHGLREHAEAYLRLRQYHKLLSIPPPSEEPSNNNLPPPPMGIVVEALPSSAPPPELPPEQHDEQLDSPHAAQARAEDLLRTGTTRPETWDDVQHQEPPPESSSAYDYTRNIAVGVGVCSAVGAGLGAFTAALVVPHGSAGMGAAVGAITGVPLGAGVGVFVTKHDELFPESPRFDPAPPPSPPPPVSSAGGNVGAVRRTREAAFGVKHITVTHGGVTQVVRVVSGATEAENLAPLGITPHPADDVSLWRNDTGERVRFVHDEVDDGEMYTVALGDSPPSKTVTLTPYYPSHGREGRVKVVLGMSDDETVRSAVPRLAVPLGHTIVVWNEVSDLIPLVYQCVADGGTYVYAAQAHAPSQPPQSQRVYGGVDLSVQEQPTDLVGAAPPAEAPPSPDRQSAPPPEPSPPPQRAVVVPSCNRPAPSPLDYLPILGWGSHKAVYTSRTTVVVAEGATAIPCTALPTQQKRGDERGESCRETGNAALRVPAESEAPAAEMAPSQPAGDASAAEVAPSQPEGDASAAEVVEKQPAEEEKESLLRRLGKEVVELVEEGVGATVEAAGASMERVQRVVAGRRKERELLEDSKNQGKGAGEAGAGEGEAQSGAGEGKG